MQIWVGGYGVSETQDPIPNSNVKPYVADGTMPEGMGEQVAATLNLHTFPLSVYEYFIMKSTESLYLSNKMIMDFLSFLIKLIENSTRFINNSCI